MKNGALLACRVLDALGVRTVFAVPGTQNLDLHEALRRSGIRVVPSTHELAASFMAIGYYRASGRIAPLVTIPGPGFTYALTGLAEARHDSAALLHLVGPQTGADRRRTFQAIDHVAVASSIVKATRRLTTSAEIAPMLSEAFALAKGGEPGPVLVEWTREALDGHQESPFPPRRDVPLELDPAELDAVARWLGAARRPLLYLGQGGLGAAGSLQSLAEWLGAPVVTTVSGRGLVPEDHPLVVAHDIGCGSLGRLNRLLRDSDAILAVGCRFAASATAGFRLQFPAERVVHVDASPEPPGCPVERSLTASSESFVPALLSRLRAQPRPASDWPAAEIARARRRVRERAWPEPAVGGSRSESAAGFFGALREVLPRDAILVTDSGTHQMLARRHFSVLSPRGLIVPSDFQSMGFGLPAAIGAKLAAPDRPVVALIGDGGFAMSGLELLTASREGVPLTVIVFVDNYLNRIRLEQLARYGRTAGTSIRNPDFADFARSVGARHVRVEADAASVLAEAVAAPGVTLVEVPVRDSLAVRLARTRGLVLEAARHAHRKLTRVLPAAGPVPPPDEEPAG